MAEQFGLIIGIYLLGLALRLPVAFVVGAAVIVFAMVFPVMPPVVVGQAMLQGLERAPLAAVPAFMLAGAIMNAGGMTERLVGLVQVVLAPLRGGLAHANIGASIVFGGISGSATADVAAIGSLFVPAMIRAGYSPAYAAAITACSAIIGKLIPPSMTMVLFGLFNDAPIDALFVAGILPGLMMGGYLLAVSVIIARRRGYPRQRALPAWAEVAKAMRASVLALAMPVAIVIALSKGLATVNEVAALSAVYALVVSTLIYRTLRLRDLYPVIRDSAVASARLLSILALAGGLLWIFANMGAANALNRSFSALQLGPTALLALVAVLLVVIGTVIGPAIQIILIAPALSPVLVAAGVDIVHFGVVAVLAAGIGLLTPPVGILLYLCAAQAGVGVAAVVRESLPFLAALLALLASIVAFPALSIGLVELWR
ncbi:MAG: TRAP transporter large permease [Burkholderiaceae bacterium]